MISQESQVFLVNGFCYKYYSENIIQYLDTSCSDNFRKFHGKICDRPILVKWYIEDLQHEDSYYLSHQESNFQGKLVFSEFWHGARNPYEVVRDRTGFSGKHFFAQKFGKMDQKWAKNRVFKIYWKIWSLIFTEFALQWKLICAPAQIPYLGKILFWKE